MRLRAVAESELKVKKKYKFVYKIKQNIFKDINIKFYKNRNFPYLFLFLFFFITNIFFRCVFIDLIDNFFHFAWLLS